MIRTMIAGAALMLATAPAIAAGGMGFVSVEAGRSDFTAYGESADDTVAGIRGGYYFNQHFGIEGFYARYGSDTVDIVRMEADGVGLGVFGKTNFGADYYYGFYITGRAGIAHSRLDVDLRGIGSDDDSDTVPYLGVGLGYDFNRNFGIGIHYDWQEPKVYDVRFKVETLTLSAEYRF